MNGGITMLLLCLEIFFARILDVSLGTVRTILTVKEKRMVASLIGFIEVTIWFIVVKEATSTPEVNLWVVTAYAGGFAVGTYLGSFISTKFIKGTLSVQIITSSRNQTLIEALRNKGFAVSVIDVQGKDGNKYLLLVEINKNKLASLEKLVYSLDKKPFIIVDDTKFVQNGFIK